MENVIFYLKLDYSVLKQPEIWNINEDEISNFLLLVKSLSSWNGRLVYLKTFSAEL